jgi:hypothetical protein
LTIINENINIKPNACALIDTLKVNISKEVFLKGGYDGKTKESVQK